MLACYFFRLELQDSFDGRRNVSDVALEIRDEDGVEASLGNSAKLLFASQQGFFDPFALRDVPGYGDQGDRVPLRVSQHGTVEFGRPAASVAVNQADLVRAGNPRRNGLANSVRYLWAILRRYQVDAVWREGQKLVDAFDPIKPCSLPVGHQESPVGSHHGDGIGGSLQTLRNRASLSRNASSVCRCSVMSSPEHKAAHLLAGLIRKREAAPGDESLSSRSRRNQVLEAVDRLEIARHQPTKHRGHPGSLPLRQARLEPVLADQLSLLILRGFRDLCDSTRSHCRRRRAPT